MARDKKVHEYFSKVFEQIGELTRFYEEGFYTGPEVVRVMQLHLHDTQELCGLVDKYDYAERELRDFFYNKEFPQKE